MSTQVFPSLPGLTYNIERTQEYFTTIQQSASGKETRVAYWNAARYTWKLTFEFLRATTAFTEFGTLFSFMSARQGRYDSFLYQDDADNAVTNQNLGVSTGGQNFQLVRQYGGSSAIAEPVLAPNAITKVVVAGSSISTASFQVTAWGSTLSPGILNITPAPTTGSTVSADFSYYWPCRFEEDITTYNEFMNKLWENKGITFRSIK